MSTILASCPLSNALGYVCDTHKSASHLSDKKNWVVGSTPLHSINHPRRTDTRNDNTLVNTDVIEIGRHLTTEEDGGPLGIDMTLAFLQQAGKLPKRTSHRNTTLGRVARTSAVLLRKRGNMPDGSEPPQGSKSNKRRLTSLDMKAKVVH